MRQRKFPLWLGLLGACLIALILILLAFQEATHG